MPGYLQPIAKRSKHLCGSLFNAMQIPGRLCRLHLITRKFFTLFQSCCCRAAPTRSLISRLEGFQSTRTCKRYESIWSIHKPLLYNRVIQLVQKPKSGFLTTRNEKLDVSFCISLSFRSLVEDAKYCWAVLTLWKKTNLFAVVEFH